MKILSINCIFINQFQSLRVDLWNCCAAHVRSNLAALKVHVFWFSCKWFEKFILTKWLALWLGNHVLVQHGSVEQVHTNVLNNVRVVYVALLIKMIIRCCCQLVTYFCLAFASIFTHGSRKRYAFREIMHIVPYMWDYAITVDTIPVFHYWRGYKQEKIQCLSNTYSHW